MRTTPHLTVLLTRQELYERVWATPMRLLAKEFGLSDVGLAKICRKHNISRPPLGYWAKVAHGQSPERPPLPAASSGKGEDMGIRLRLISPAARENEIDVIEETAPEIVVVDRIIKPHPLVAVGPTGRLADSKIRLARSSWDCERSGISCKYEHVINKSPIGRQSAFVNGANVRHSANGTRRSAARNFTTSSIAGIRPVESARTYALCGRELMCRRHGRIRAHRTVQP